MSEGKFFRTEIVHEVRNWKEQAQALFFVDHVGVTEIAAVVSRARETVSRYLNDCEGYEAEMAFRRKQSEAQRREYKRQWDRHNRAGLYDITKDSLRREHEIAVRVLSAEKF